MVQPAFVSCISQPSTKLKTLEEQWIHTHDWSCEGTMAESLQKSQDSTGSAWATMGWKMVILDKHNLFQHASLKRALLTLAQMRKQAVMQFVTVIPFVTVNSREYARGIQTESHSQ